MKRERKLLAPCTYKTDHPVTRLLEVILVNANIHIGALWQPRTLTCALQTSNTCIKLTGLATKSTLTLSLNWLPRPQAEWGTELGVTQPQYQLMLHELHYTNYMYLNATLGYYTPTPTTTYS